MPRSFDMSTDYVVTVGEVLRAFSDEQYWLARLTDSGADDTTLDSMQLGGPSGDDGTIDVVTTQVLRADRLPGVVTQFHRGDLLRETVKDADATARNQQRRPPIVVDANVDAILRILEQAEKASPAK